MCFYNVKLVIDWLLFLMYVCMLNFVVNSLIIELVWWVGEMNGFFKMLFFWEFFFLTIYLSIYFVYD